MLVHELIFRGQDEAIAIIDGDRRIDYRTLQQKTAVYRDYFYSIGIRQNDHVAIFSRNSAEYIFAYMAVNSLGAGVVPINFQLSNRETAYILKDASVTHLLTYKELDLAAALAAQDYHQPVQQVLLSQIDELIAKQPLPAAPVLPADFNEDHTCIILYTSGTTGSPKGAVLSHRNMIADAVFVQKVIDIKSTDNVLCVLPMYHSFGWTCAVTNPLLCGACITILDSFTPRETLDTIRRGKISAIYAVPSIYSLLAKLGQKEDLASIRISVSGGASIAKQQAQNFMDKFGLKIQEGYGLSESAPVVTMTAPGKEKLGSIGPALPGLEVKIVDTDNNEVPVGEPGELIVRGDTVMKRYLNLPEKTAETLRDGWLHTGDVACRDSDGYIFIVDRIKDMIISMGENIYPREVEEVVYTFPGIHEAAVVGVPDRLRGQSGVCFFVPDEGVEIQPRALKKYLQENLALYKVPREFKQLEALPKTSTGKIAKRMILDDYLKDK